MSSGEPAPGHGDPVNCSRCGQRMGRMVNIKGQLWLLLGDMIVVRNAFGVCGKCGAQFHWSVADRMLSEIVQQMLRDQAMVKSP